MKNFKLLTKNRLLLILGFLLAASLTLGVLILLKPKSTPSKKLGEIHYDQTLIAAERQALSDILSEYQPATDIVISAKTETIRPSIPNSLVWQISVPVADFRSPLLDISSQSPELKLVPLEQLSPRQRLLSLDQKYFFDDFNSGAFFRNLYFEGESSQNLIDKIKPNLPNYPERDSLFSLTQTGVTALGRRINNTLNTHSPEHLGSHIKDFLLKSDLTHISNELSFVDRCFNPPTSTVLCSDSRFFDLILDLGIDIVELTGNHNNDYGPAANIQTINLYHQHKIQTFGGGKNQIEAARPLQLNQKANQVTLLGYNLSTSTIANGQIATGSQPGANLYQSERARAEIAAAKQKGPVIVSIQYFECFSYPSYGTEMPACDRPISGQSQIFRQLIDFGADLVIGTQAHQPQTFELYQNKPIFYGLGNLFFDQIAWPGTTRSLVLTHYFWQNRLINIRISPTSYDQTFQPKLMSNVDAEKFLKRLTSHQL